MEDDDEEGEEQLVFVPQEVLEEALMEEALEDAAEQELAQVSSCDSSVQDPRIIDFPSGIGRNRTTLSNR